MRRKAIAFVAALLTAVPLMLEAGELKPVNLPAPEKTGGKPLMQVLNERKSTRVFRSEKLPPQVLSNLLWAAFGINRTDGRRTAPSASNRQEIDLYVATADGLYTFDAKGSLLRPVLADDIRPSTGTQDFVRDAALSIVYVADLAKMGQTPPEDKLVYSAADTGFIAENVYLFCASEGLATVVRASVNRPALATLMRLRPEQRIVLVQSVGYPKQ